MSNLASITVQSLSRKCSNCGHYGASLVCKVAACTRIYHFPCATAAGAFQDAKTITMFCNQHLGQVPLLCESKLKFSKDLMLIFIYNFFYSYQWCNLHNLLCYWRRFQFNVLFILWTTSSWSLCGVSAITRYQYFKIIF